MIKRRYPVFDKALLWLAACTGNVWAAGDAEIPQVDVQCGVAYSLTAMANYGPWTSQIQSAMGSSAWNQVLLLTYSPFVIVKNNTGWPLVLNGGSTTHPQVTFDQPKIGLRFKRIGDSHAGFVTTSPVPLDQMYVSGSSTKTFTLNLYGAGSPPSGFETLAPGESRGFSAYIPSTATLDTVLDWRSDLTNAILAGPGWMGATAGYCADYLAGTYREPVVNGNQVLIPTRSQDSWDVEISTTGPLNGCRVFHNTSPVSPTWPWKPEATAEVTTFPFKLTDYQSAIPASAMFATYSQPVHTWPVKPLFSVLLPPRSITGFVTDKNNNGINDEWEKHYFGGLSSDPYLDPDGDGFSNYVEFLTGTSPVSGADFITQKLSQQPEGGLDFQWSSVVNRSYVVETSSNLSDWSPSETITATTTECRYPVIQSESGVTFARLRILPVK